MMETTGSEWSKINESVHLQLQSAEKSHFLLTNVSSLNTMIKKVESGSENKMEVPKSRCHNQTILRQQKASEAMDS